MALIDGLQFLRAFLLADSAISTAVGNARVYPTNLAQGQREPSIVFTLVSEQTIRASLRSTGLVFARVQVDCWAATHAAAASLALLVKERLDGYRGQMGGAVVQGIFSEAASYNYDAAATLYRVSRDYFIDYEER